jgi:UDP-N-acetylmuramoylalanine--D-glutamate ligase
MAPGLGRALDRFSGAEHRLEPCGVINGAKCFNDSIATSPESTLAALSAFQAGVHLLLGGSDKGLDYTELAEAIAAHPGVKGVYLQGANADAIERALRKARVESRRFKTLDEACQAAIAELQSGDVLLLSPASASFYEYAPSKRFSNFEHRGRHFKALVKAHANQAF